MVSCDWVLEVPQQTQVFSFLELCANNGQKGTKLKQM